MWTAPCEAVAALANGFECGGSSVKAFHVSSSGERFCIGEFKKKGSSKDSQCGHLQVMMCPAGMRAVFERGLVESQRRFGVWPAGA